VTGKKHYDRIDLILSVISKKFGQWLTNDQKRGCGRKTVRVAFSVKVEKNKSLC